MLYFYGRQHMYSKLLQKIVFILVSIMIFIGVFIYISVDYFKTPSQGWSKDIKLFSIEASTGYDDFFSKRLTYLKHNDQLYITYLEDGSINYRSIDQGDLGQVKSIIKPEFPVDEIYLEVVEDKISMLLVSEDTIYMYTLDSNFNLINTPQKLNIKNTLYDIDHGHVILRQGDGYRIYIGQTYIDVALAFRPYDVQVSLIKDDVYTLYYTAIHDNTPEIRRAVISEEGDLIQDEFLVSFITDDLRLKILNMEIVENGQEKGLILNVKDTKFGSVYLNYYLFNSNDLISQEAIDFFQDKVQLITPTEWIVSMNHQVMADHLGNHYYDFYNLALYDYETQSFKPLTKTKKGPTQYLYFKDQNYKYLVWGELKRGEMTLRMASNQDEIILESTRYNRERFFEIFYETIAAFMPIYTYGLIVAVSTLSITMLTIVPGHMIFISFFEKHQEKVLGLMIIIHNIGKLLIHFKFVEKYALPSFLQTAFVPIIIMTNILAFYNYKVINHHRNFDNALSKYVPFYLTDIILHIMIFGPYILLRFQ